MWPIFYKLDFFCLLQNIKFWMDFQQCQKIVPKMNHFGLTTISTQFPLVTPKSFILGTIFWGSTQNFIFCSRQKKIQFVKYWLHFVYCAWSHSWPT